MNAIDYWYGLEVGRRLLAPPNVIGGAPQSTDRTTEQAVQSGLSGVLGGNRTGTLTATGTLTSKSEVQIVDGGLYQSNAASAQSRLSLEYGSTVNPLNVNFLSLGVGGYFLLDDWTLDGGTMNATLTLTSGSTVESKSLSLGAASFDTPVDYEFAFSYFSNAVLADVDSIKLEFQNTGGSQDSGVLHAFVAIPEPSTYAAVLALSVLGLAGFRRSWRREAFDAP